MVGAFTASSEISFQAKIDSKGRITVPAEIRERLSLEKGDSIPFKLAASRVIVEEVGSRDEALRFIESFDSVRSFSYEAGVVEVVLDV